METDYSRKASSKLVWIGGAFVVALTLGLAIGYMVGHNKSAPIAASAPAAPVVIDLRQPAAPNNQGALPTSDLLQKLLKDLGGQDDSKA